MYKIIRLSIAFLCILLLPLEINAQLMKERIRTVAIISPMGNANLRVSSTAQTISFPLNTIPANTTIRSCYLELTVAADITPQKSMKIEANGKNAFAYFNSTCKKDSVLQIQLDSSIIQGTTISLKLSVQKGEVAFENNANAPGKCPHLVIDYEVTPSIPIPWASSQANSQHTANTYTRFAGLNPTTFSKKELINLGAIQTDLVVYQNNIYAINYANNQTKLYAIDINSGNATIIKEGLGASIQIMPAISNSGYLYYPTGNKMIVINLNNPSENITPISIAGTKNITTAPTIGKDGSLYLVLNDIIYAYSPYPQHQLLWQYSLTSDKSPITLNKEGTIAYFVDYNSQKLISINTINGRELARSADNVVFESSSKSPTIPMVNNYGNIYVCDKLQGGTKMSIFDKKMKLIRTIKGTNISRAASGSNSGANLGAIEDSLAFFLKGGYLMQTYPHNTRDSVNLASDLTAYSLVADASNNVYCLGTNNKLYAAYYAGNPQLSTSFSTDINAQKAMIIAPDGTLHTATSGSLYRFSASSFNGDFTFSPTAKMDWNDIVFRATNITINEKITAARQGFVASGKVTVNAITIDKTASATIGIGNNGISFKSGFTVKTGATLSCKTGY